MSIETDARQEAERRWPSPNSGLYEGLIIGFEKGAVWAHEQDDREPSDDPCPEWNCPDLSAEDRRDGKTCPEHPCTCDREPSDAEVEAAARKVFETDAPSHEPEEWFTVSPQMRNDYRATARAALLAAQEVRNRG